MKYRHGRCSTSRPQRSHMFSFAGLLIALALAGMLRLSIALPANPSRAGSSVMAATTATRTTIAAAVAIMPTNAIPEIHSPSSAIATVIPANTTAWPAVAIARPIACSGLHAGLQVLAVPRDDEQA